jgi:hypothetical protein
MIRDESSSAGKPWLYGRILSKTAGGFLWQELLPAASGSWVEGAICDDTDLAVVREGAPLQIELPVSVVLVRSPTTGRLEFGMIPEA